MARSKEFYRKIDELLILGLKTCSKCKDDKSVDNFDNAPKTYTKLSSTCKSCHLSYCNERNRERRSGVGQQDAKFPKPIERKLKDDYGGAF